MTPTQWIISLRRNKSIQTSLKWGSNFDWNSSSYSNYSMKVQPRNYVNESAWRVHIIATKVSLWRRHETLNSNKEKNIFWVESFLVKAHRKHFRWSSNFHKCKVFTKCLEFELINLKKSELCGSKGSTLISQGLQIWFFTKCADN